MNVQSMEQIGENLLMALRLVMADKSIPTVVDREQEVDEEALPVASAVNIGSVRNGLRLFRGATNASQHGLCMRLSRNFSANLFFSTNRLYTNKGFISF